MADFTHIPLTAVNPDPAQPRTYFDEKKMAELAESIRSHGVIQPIAVSRQADGGYRIHHGERRWRAAGMAGLTDIPCIVEEPLDDETRLARGIVENVQRADLNVIEEANAYGRLRQMGWPVIRIARETGRSAPTIKSRLRWLEIAEPIQELAAAGQLPRDGRVVEALLSVPNKEARLKLAQRAAGQGMTIKSLQTAARKIRQALETKQIGSGANRALAVAANGNGAQPPAAAKYKWQRVRKAAAVTCRECDLIDMTNGVPEPAWSLVQASAGQVCGKCDIRFQRDLVVCQSCPLPQMLAQMMEAGRE